MKKLKLRANQIISMNAKFVFIILGILLTTTLITPVLVSASPTGNPIIDGFIAEIQNLINTLNNYFVTNNLPYKISLNFKCLSGYLQEFRCYGKYVQQKYQSSTCGTSWKNKEYCNYGCLNSVCNLSPTTTTTTTTSQACVPGLDCPIITTTTTTSSSTSTSTIPPSCSGEVILRTSPNSGTKGTTLLQFSVSGVSNCDEKMVYINRKSSPTNSNYGDCGTSPTVASCKIYGYCSTSFNEVVTADVGAYTYIACIDKNGDGDWSDLGEQSALSSFLISLPCSSGCPDVCNYGDARGQVRWYNGQCVDDCHYSSQEICLYGCSNGKCNSISSNYQENPTSYFCEGDWSSGYPCSNIVDGNWNTWGEVVGNPKTAIIYTNYTKPIGASNTILWQVKGGFGNTYNYTLDKSNYLNSILCGNQNPIQLKIISLHNHPTHKTEFYCWTGSSWYLRGYNVAIYENYVRIYEEAVFWNIG